MMPLLNLERFLGVLRVFKSCPLDAMKCLLVSVVAVARALALVLHAVLACMLPRSEADPPPELPLDEVLFGPLEHIHSVDTLP